MKTTTQPHGVHYEFNNGCTLSVINDWAAMGNEERPLEFMLFTPCGATDAVGYQTEDQIAKLIQILENNDEEVIKEIVDRYKPYDVDYSTMHSGCEDHVDSESAFNEFIYCKQRLDCLRIQLHITEVIAIVHTAFGGPEGNTLYWYIDFYNVDKKLRCISLELRGQDRVPFDDEIQEYVEEKGCKLAAIFNH